jgi:hypothetical protein
MRTVYLLTFLLILSLIASAQSFHRGAVVIDVGTGIEYYQTRQGYERIVLQTGHDTAVKSQAGSTHFTAGLEVGLNKHFGIGIRGKMNSFISDMDNVIRQKPQVTSKDLIVSLNLHPVVRKNVDVILGADLGVSTVVMNYNDLSNTKVTSFGTYIAPYLNPRIYFGRFGFNLKTYIPFLNYSDFSNKPTGENAGEYALDKWKGSGFGISLGVQVRLF